MGTKLRASPKFSMTDNNGNPASGWKIYTYVSGTTTPKATYIDNAQSAANTNPVILDSRGEANIWWSGSYKVVVTDANDVTIYTVDNYGAGEDISVSGFYNLATNGSFEIDENADNLPDDWVITEYDATSTVVIDTTDPSHGANCLKFVSTGLGGGYAASVLMEVSGSQDLLIGFDVKSSVVDVRNRVEIQWFDENQSLLSTSGIWDESAANPTTWTEMQFTTTAHASARYAKMVAYGAHSSDVTPGETRFDNMRVIAVTGTMMLQDSDAVAITGGTIDGISLTETTNLFTTPPSTTSYGVDTVTNGNFASDVSWTKGTGWTIASGVASSDGTQSADSLLTQAQTTVDGHQYLISFDVTAYTAGNIAVQFNSVEVITNKAATGTYTATVTASGTSNALDIVADLDFIGSIDNVTVTDITYAATLGEVAYVTNRVYAVTIHTDSTGSATLNLDTIGAKTIRTPFGATLSAGALQAGQAAYFSYDGTDLILLNSQIMTDSNFNDNTINGAKVSTATITALQMGVDSVDQPEVAAGAIHQGELHTTTASQAANVVTSVDISLNAYSFEPDIEASIPASGMVVLAPKNAASPSASADSPQVRLNTTGSDTYNYSAAWRYMVA